MGSDMAYILDLPPALPERSLGSGARFAPWRFLSRVVRNGVHEWMVRRTIESLNALDDRTLKDIGIYRSGIESHVRQHMTRAL